LAFLAFSLKHLLVTQQVGPERFDLVDLFPIRLPHHHITTSPHHHARAPIANAG
jgi:hypothetical protein